MWPKMQPKNWRFFGSWRASTFFASTKFDFQSAYLQILLYNRWKFEVDIFSSFWEHSRTSGPLKIHKNVNIWRNIWRNEKQKNHYQVHVNIYHPWKFQKDWTTYIREIACTKSVRKKIIIEKKKPYNNNKVFRWKRKTLIIIRNRVKPICSQTPFGEHN